MASSISVLVIYNRAWDKWSVFKKREKNELELFLMLYYHNHKLFASCLAQYLNGIDTRRQQCDL